MSWGLTGVIIGAVVGIGTTAYQTHEADKIRKEEEEAYKKAEAEALNNERLALSNVAARNKQEGATIKFGSGDPNDDIGSYDDFLTPSLTKKKTLSGLTSGSTTGGLAFS